MERSIRVQPHASEFNNTIDRKRERVNINIISFLLSRRGWKEKKEKKQKRQIRWQWDADACVWRQRQWRRWRRGWATSCLHHSWSFIGERQTRCRQRLGWHEGTGCTSSRCRRICIMLFLSHNGVLELDKQSAELNRQLDVVNTQSSWLNGYSASLMDKKNPAPSLEIASININICRVWLMAALRNPKNIVACSSILDVVGRQDSDVQSAYSGNLQWSRDSAKRTTPGGSPHRRTHRARRRPRDTRPQRHRGPVLAEQRQSHVAFVVHGYWCELAFELWLPCLVSSIFNFYNFFLNFF